MTSDDRACGLIIQAPRFNKGHAKKGDLRELTVANKLTSQSLVDIKLGGSAAAFFVENTADQIIFMTVAGKQYIALQDIIDGNVIVKRMKSVYDPYHNKEEKHDVSSNSSASI